MLQAAVAAGRIVIMQAANTGLTGGSTPDGANYDREIVLVNTLRLTGQARVGGLHDDDAARRHSSLQHLPLLQQRAGAHNGQHRAFARAVAFAKAPGGLVVGEDMGGAHGVAQLRKQSLAADVWRGAHASRTSKSAEMSATLATLVSVMATRISFSSSSSRCLTPASPAAASA